MDRKKNRLVNGIVSILILIISLALMIVDFVSPSINILLHPVLTFLLCVLVGFGVFFIVSGLIKKSAFSTLGGSFCFGLALLYVLSCLLVWWIGLIVTVTFWLVMCIVSTMINGNSADDCAMNKEGDGYRTYEARKQDKEEKEDNSENKSSND